VTRRLLIISGSLAAMLALSVGVWAYFTTTGSGLASASSGTLNAPANPSASTSGANVTVDWDAAFLGDGSTPAENYTVERFTGGGSDVGAACGGATIPSSSGLPNASGHFHCTDTPGSGTFKYKITATYRSWTATSAFTNSVTPVTDSTPPYVTAIDRADASPTNASSLHWTVTFSESVTGVDTSDFALARTGITGGSVTGVSGSGSGPYTVTATTGTGDGSLGLNLVDDDSIHDGAGNPLGTSGGAGNGNFTGQTYAIDKTVPVVTITQVNAVTRTFPYTTNANVSSLGGACSTGDSTVSVTINGSPAAPQTTTCSSGVWTLALTTALAADGNYTVAATQSDVAGNGGSSGNKTVTIDKTPPTNVLSLVNQSTQAGPSTTTNPTSFLSGTTLWYDGGTSGNFKLQNALTDSRSGPASSTFATLGGTTSGWTFTGSTVTTPSGGPYVSSQFGWNSGTASPATEGVTGTDAAGNTNTASTLTFRNDSLAPTDTITFPATNGNYKNAAWDAGSCATGGICGAAGDPGSTGANPPIAGTQSSTANSSSGATSLAITAPSSVATGDVLIAGLTVSSNNTSITAPSGWTLINRTNSGSNISAASYYHVVTNGASEPSSYTWTFGGSFAASGGIVRYVGVDTSDPIDASSIVAGNDSSPTAPSVTTTSANDLVVALFGSDSTGTFTPPSGMTERYDVHNTSASGPGTEAADVAQASAGATGAKAATATASARWVAQLIALNPAPPNISGLAKVQVSIQATSGANINKYWDPSANAGAGGFTSASEVLVLASGTSSWSLAFPSSNFTDAKYTIRAYAVDNVGNYTTTPASVTNVTIDNAVPSTTDNTASIGNAWRNTTATVTLTPTDTGSGVAATYYTTNGSTPTTSSTQGSSISLATTGVYTIKYFSVDTAGNQEAVKTASTQIRIDKLAPTNAFSLNVSSGGAFLSDATLYYKSNAAGSLTLTDAVSDGDSGPASANFPLFNTTNGMNHNTAPALITTPAGGPYTSTAYSWTSGATFATAQSITGADVAGNAAATSVNFVIDSAAPTGGAVTVNGTSASAGGSTSVNPSGSFSISTLTQYTDAGSGLASSTLVREEAPLNAEGTGTCGTTWTNPATITATRTENSSVGISSGNCYRYTLTGTDNVGNTAQIQTIVKVDTTPPSTPVLTITPSGSFAFVNGTTVYYNGTTGTSSSVAISATTSDSESGIQKVNFPALTSFTGGGDDASSPYSTSYTWTTSADSGTKTVTATNGIGTTAATTFSLVNDVAAPAGGALTVNGVVGSTGGSTSTATSTFAINTRTDYAETQSASQSGFASGALSIQSETLTGSTCGAPGSGGPFTSATTIAGTTQPLGIVPGFCYLYALTGTDNVGNAASVKTTVLVTDAFQVSNPGARTVGTAFNVTLTALFNGTTDTGYTGSKTVTFAGPSNAPDGTAPTYPATVSFSNGVGTASITLVDAESATLTATQGAITGTSPSFTVNPGSAARLAWTNITTTSGTAIPTPCLFSCSYVGFGSNKDFTAKVSVTDSRGNIVSGLGIGHTVSVTQGGDGGGFTAPTTGTSVNLTIATSGLASSTATFTFSSQSGNWNSDTLTAHTTGGTSYTDAGATLFK
jgi:large repetitive protein